MQITIYTDGACDIHAENQPGGWAAILLARDERGTLLKETVLSGGAEATTNNQMELTAVIQGLKALKSPAQVTVVTDSRYVIDVASGAKKSRVNGSLWVAYRAAAAAHSIDWTHVAGHSGDALNERCDRLAVQEKRARAIPPAQHAHPPTPDPATDAAIYISTAADKSKSASAFAAFVIRGRDTAEISGRLPGKSELEATLIAALRALESLPAKESAAVHTAQEYLAKGMNAWAAQWQRNGWKTKGGQPVKHKRHWQRLRDLCQGRQVHFQFVKSRDGLPYFQQGKEKAAALLQGD